jgi:hypothetical protein
MNTHEELTREHAVRGSSDRAFGIVSSVFFALAGLASLLKHRPIRFLGNGFSRRVSGLLKEDQPAGLELPLRKLIYTRLTSPSTILRFRAVTDR